MSTDYRREIDGLRALAVLPVVLFHAGIPGFAGGYVGVDVFFVISGFLITGIMLGGLESGGLALGEFYERRARRILPALAVVMTASLVAGHLTLMPDEHKNLGQSLVATSLFSNNILLALTTGYWDLAAEFKPLLHTWSLGVEEQYYLLAPIAFVAAWRFAPRALPLLLAMVAASSLAFCIWLARWSPDWAFYSLPSRAWEIAVGGLAAFSARRPESALAPTPLRQLLGLAGLCLIVVPMLLVGGPAPSPVAAALAPVAGTVLVLLHAREGTVVHALLGSRLPVAIGLASYSIYLWHQPILAFLRATSAEPPGMPARLLASLAVLGVAALSYRWVERPFRDRRFLTRRAVLGGAAGVSLAFVAVGAWLDASYGMPSRLGDPSFEPAEMDKRLYNRRAFDHKRDAFADDGRRRVLIIGNSFGRDFTNLTIETFDTSGAEIIYRDDLAQGILPFHSGLAERLFGSAEVIVFASGFADPSSLASDLAFARERGKRLYYVGNKHFGHNLNWVMSTAPAERALLRNAVPPHVIAADSQMRATIPATHFISLLGPLLRDGTIPITDERGRMLSTDRVHLTRPGAIFLGDCSVRPTDYAREFTRPTPGAIQDGRR